MLQSLRIRNLALIEELALDFDSGFTAVTGETGAGKSVLLGALSLLAGERADKTVIRQGAGSCEVEAVLFFKSPQKVDTLLGELELPLCEDGTLILKRSVSRDKAPKITINGGFATLAALQRLGEAWIDFHGPSEPRRLLKESCQLELLDLFSGDEKALADYAAQYRVWRSLKAEREHTASAERLSPDQIEFLEGQLRKIEALQLEDGAIEALERDYARMSRSQEIVDASTLLTEGLRGEDGLAARLAALLREARTLENLDAATKALADRLASASVELADIAEEYESLGRECQFDAEEAELLRTRMDAWLDAKRRYGADLEAVKRACDEMRRKLELQGDIEGACRRLDKQIAEAEKAVRGLASKLREQREKAARELAKTASKSIVQLGFKKADFQVKLQTLEEFGPAGDCRCEFQFSPNVGEAPLPLNRIASSGELARVMLALKTVLADLDSVPVLVFDEVDANVGGEIGRIVGEKMAQIARGHQVFCVTHLPQVAAQAQRHFLVEKDQSGDRAEVRISPLHDRRRARVSELARMLGDRNAKSALAHAEELLSGS